MSAISTYLEYIRSKIYAKDVRTAIVNAISQCYDDVNKPALQTEAMQAAVQAKIDAGQMAALTIGDGTITAAKLASGVLDDCAQKSSLNNSFGGASYTWELGTLNPSIGTESSSSTRIRSTYIPVSKGTVITLEKPLSRLVVYCYDSDKGYVSDSPWLSGNSFEITNASVAFIRVLIRKNTSDSTIGASEIDGLVDGLTIDFSVPSETYTDISVLPRLRGSLDGSRYLTVEIGSMSDGRPTVSSAYVRAADFFKANKGDVLTVSPVGFSLYYGCVYKYSADNLAGYYDSVSIPATTSGNTWRYIFTEDCYFKFRVSNASSGANISPHELYKFDMVFRLEHIYSSDELSGKVHPLGVDYNALNAAITGKYNLAIQTDTHMAKNIAYTGKEYLPSDFHALESVVGAVNSLEINLFANLGDIIRGYQADPDYESRLSADAIMEVYKDIRTNRAFVIGNHDDGCLFYHDSLYNDNRNSAQIMFPSEQFNRYTKYGINNAYISNYYYKDISGVRIITLWQRDYNYSQDVPTIESFNIGQTQLDWLTGTALNTDLPVIIMCHAPLVSTIYSTSRGGFDAVLTALNAFVSGGGTVIAVLCGHTHARGADKVDGINHIVFKNGYDFFELVSIDTANRTITCTLVGTSGDSRTFTY